MAVLKRLILAPGLALIAGIALNGCIFSMSASISDSAGKGTPVSTSVDDMGYLLLIPPQGMTDRASAQLAGQCASGKLTDVQTELSVRNVLGIVQFYNVKAAGACI